MTRVYVLSPLFFFEGLNIKLGRGGMRKLFFYPSNSQNFSICSDEMEKVYVLHLNYSILWILLQCFFPTNVHPFCPEVSPGSLTGGKDLIQFRGMSETSSRAKREQRKGKFL